MNKKPAKDTEDDPVDRIEEAIDDAVSSIEGAIGSLNSVVDRVERAYAAQAKRRLSLLQTALQNTLAELPPYHHLVLEYRSLLKDKYAA